jgi:hypothetical protein
MKFGEQLTPALSFAIWWQKKWFLVKVSSLPCCWYPSMACPSPVLFCLSPNLFHL